MSRTADFLLVHAMSVLAALIFGTVLTRLSRMLGPWLSLTVGRESRRYVRRVNEDFPVTRKSSRKKAGSGASAVQPRVHQSPSLPAKLPPASKPLPHVVARQADFTLISR